METELNRQQICAALGVSESTIRRLEGLGLPFTPVGVRSKRYNLEECKNWLRTQYVPGATAPVLVGSAREMWKRGKEFTDLCKNQKLRVYPSEPKTEKDAEFETACKRAMIRMKPSSD
jgi:hypothetical protein